MQLKDLFTLIPSSSFEKTEYITQTKYSLRRKHRRYWTFRCRLPDKEAGILTLVLSKSSRTALTGCVLVTNNEVLTTCEICILYSYRWAIETFYRDVKQELHLEDATITI